MSPTKGQRGRDAARRRAAQAAVREAARRRQQRLRVIIAGAVAVVVVLALVLATIPDGGDDDDRGSDTTSTTDGTSTTAPDAGAEPTPIDDEPLDPDAEFAFGSGECAPDTKPESPRREPFADSFQNCLTEGAAYKAVVGTSEGAFTIDLLPNRAPGAVNNFIQLAKWGWYDGDDFHRVEPGFVIQGGDPVGDPPGTGGPGYSFADELPAAVSVYTPGAVAMANSGPNTNGSQFFVCIDCSVLPSPGYSLFGWVSDGWEVVRAINGTQGGEVEIVAVEILEDPLAEG